MKLKKENEQFDTWLEASDWRYSAAIVGLSAFLDFFEYEIEYELSDDYLKFNEADITEERYLEFAEDFLKISLSIRILSGTCTLMSGQKSR